MPGLQANLDGTNPHPIINPISAEPNGIALDGSHLCWTNTLDGTVSEANLDGSNPHVIVSLQSDPIGVAVGSA